MMDLRQLRYFVGIVQAGSLSRAAGQMHIAQSAISHHLASLEEELGRQLVTRGPKGIVLTEPGTVLYRHAEAILRHLEVAKQDAMSALSVPSGRVSIGFPSALSAILGYDLLLRVREAYPQVLLHLSDGNSSLLRERLDNGRLDLAVLFVGHAERGLAVEPLLLEELFYITAAADDSPISLSEAAQHPLLVPGPGSGIQRTAQDAFSSRGLTIRQIGEVDTLPTLRRAVAAGMGNTILPWSALYEGDSSIRLYHRRFANAALTRPVALCFSEVAQRNPAMECVATTLKTLICELAKGGRWQGVTLIADEVSLSPLPP